VIARLIDACIHNRVMVVIMTVFLVLAGVWSSYRITVDAIPDLSDVQVIIRTEYVGQAPQIVEQQVTYPLTTAMLAVPGAEVVRGYSMFGSSFVYIIFEDGTDLYWARSRVLEQLSVLAARLPDGVSPQLGPDATGVGWVFEYVLDTGSYCPDHPQGLWRDPATGEWYADPYDAPTDEVRTRLVHQRVLGDQRTVFVDMQGNQYEKVADAPTLVRDKLATLVVDEVVEHCPLDGKPLAHADVDLSQLRSLQDWYLRYELTPIEGVSEVATIGGFVKQYQVVVDPVRLLAYDMSITHVKQAIQQSNVDVGGALIEMSEREYMVRGLGYLGTPGPTAEEVETSTTQRVLEQLRTIALGATAEGAPIYLQDVAEARIGPAIRRGIAEWNGEGETVGAIVVMRFGENALDTIERVKARLTELERGLPPGVAIRIGYDRSDLINRAVETLRRTLMEEILVVALVIVLFLLHARSALVAAFVLPTGVLASLSIMHVFGINANIMSLGGIAIAIGVMVDSSIIMVENAHKHLEDERNRVAAGEAARPRTSIIAEAAKEVGPSLFFSLLIITVSFLPVFALEGESGRLFKPLAFTKTFAMGSAAILAVTIIPVLMTYFLTERVVPKDKPAWLRWSVYALVVLAPAAALAFVPLPTLESWRLGLVIGWIILSALLVLPQRIWPEERNPISRVLQAVYDPAFALVMFFRWPAIIVAALVVLLTLWPLKQLGSEFMPPLEEGDLLYMPTTTEPGLSITKAKELLQQTDKLIGSFPEVEAVFGKIGRADSATDPAPLNMIETTITLHRDRTKWRHVSVDRFFTGWPDWMRWLPEQVWPTQRPITLNELVYGYTWSDGSRVPGMNESIQIPGLANSWTMPIRTRIDMLATGIRTPVGIKVLGPDLATLSDISEQIAQVVRTAPGTGAYTTSAFSEKSVGGNYLDIHIDREAIARYGLRIAQVQDVIMSALGGMNVSNTVEGLERYPINVRYPSELRDNIDALRNTLVATPGGAHVPLAQLTTMEFAQGPPMIKSENARLTSWVFVDVAGIDVGTYVANAQRAVAREVVLPAGYTIVWSGQFQYMQEARERLTVIVPLTAVIIIVLLYLATRSWLRVGIVLLAIPFSLVGAVWLLYFLDYNLSLAVWVGMIALAGLDAETGLVMLLYLDNSFERFKSKGHMRNRDDLWRAVHDGAVKRIRPKTMTVVTTFTGLIPLMWATGAGADTMRRLAAPMIGGLATSFIMELLLYPVLFFLAKSVAMRSAWRRELNA